MLSIKRLIPAALLLVVNFAHSQVYFGINYLGMDYTQPNVTSAILAPSDDPVVIIEQRDGGERPELFRDLDLSLQAASFKYGYPVSDWLSFEVRGGFGVSPGNLKDYSEELTTIPRQIPNPDFDPTMPIDAMDNPLLRNITVTRTERIDADLNMRYFYGAYVRVGGNFRNVIASPYILWGRSRGSFDVTETSGTGGGSLSSDTYGIGVNVRVLERSYLNLEYVDFFDSKNVEVTSWSLGLEYRL